MNVEGHQFLRFMTVTDMSSSQIHVQYSGW